MADLDALRELSKRPRVTLPCAVALAFTQLPTEEVEFLKAGMKEDPAAAIMQQRKPITNAGVARYINKLLPNADITWQAVRNHRTHTCACSARRGTH